MSTRRHERCSRSTRTAVGATACPPYRATKNEKESIAQSQNHVVYGSQLHMLCCCTCGVIAAVAALGRASVPSGSLPPLPPGTTGSKHMQVLIIRYAKNKKISIQPPTIFTIFHSRKIRVLASSTQPFNTNSDFSFGGSHAQSCGVCHINHFDCASYYLLFRSSCSAPPW